MTSADSALALIEVGRSLERAESRATLARIEASLVLLHEKVDASLRIGVHTVSDLSAIDTAVDALEGRLTDLTDAEEASSTLLDEIAQLLRDNATDPEAIAAIAERITAVDTETDSVRARLAAAVVRNTDVDPTPPAPPEG